MEVMWRLVQCLSWRFGGLGQNVALGDGLVEDGMVEDHLCVPIQELAVGGILGQGGVGHCGVVLSDVGYIVVGQDSVVLDNLVGVELDIPGVVQCVLVGLVQHMSGVVLGVCWCIGPGAC